MMARRYDTFAPCVTASHHAAGRWPTNPDGRSCGGILSPDATVLRGRYATTSEVVTRAEQRMSARQTRRHPGGVQPRADGRRGQSGPPAVLLHTAKLARPSPARPAARASITGHSSIGVQLSPVALALPSRSGSTR
jgi:hypothetical protein